MVVCITVIIAVLVAVLTAGSIADAAPVSVPASAEMVIATDVAVQAKHDDAAYLACRAKHEAAPECREIIAAIKKNQPEADVIQDVVTAKLTGIKPLSEKLAAGLTRLDIYKTVWPQVTTYYVAIDYQLKKESRWFYNGVNYRLYVLALEDDHWVIVEASMAPVNIIQSAGYGFGTMEEARAAEIERVREKTGKFVNPRGEVIEDVAATAAQLQEEKGTATAIQPLVVNEHTRPSSIRVYRVSLGRVDTVDFYYYVKNVLPNEWNPSWDIVPLRSGALACKMYGWYYVYHPHSSSYDVRDDNYDQVYSPGSENIDPDTTTAINDVGGIGVDRADGVLFITHYWAGYYGPGRYGPPSCPTDGWMWQNGTKYWYEHGSNGYTYCVHYYYDNSNTTAGQLAHFFYY